MKKPELYTALLKTSRDMLLDDGFDLFKSIDLTEEERAILENPKETWPMSLSEKLLPIGQRYGECRMTTYFVATKLGHVCEWWVLTDRDEIDKLNKEIEEAEISVFEIFDTVLRRSDSAHITLNIYSSTKGTSYKLTSRDNLDEKLSEVIKQLTKNEPRLKDRLLTDKMYACFRDGHTNIRLKTFIMALHMLGYELMPNVKLKG